MIAVVAGIVRQNDRILICQRPAGKLLPGVWEFPGGKMEPGETPEETPEEALARELWEELGFEARVGRIYDARAE
jgi:mutator protein MutT